MPNYQLYQGDCLEILPTLPDQSVDAIITDPPYPGISRPYGKWTESQWQEMMQQVVMQARRILKPKGSAVFILQPNSEHVGKMRSWLWEFMAWVSKQWNIVQDVWWWNFTTPPLTHSHRKVGLLRGSVKACVWVGSPDCYRNQDEILWTESESNDAERRSRRAFRQVSPSGISFNRATVGLLAKERGGVTPFNLIPCPTSDSKSSGGAYGHPAATPDRLCQWWVKYICPPNGVVLDPFSGSASVGVSALKLDRSYIGIEKLPEYLAIAKVRLAQAL